ncbi:hypothetical protein BegalDRAFT_0314 [Beggiatoa alba B18LD]|uniref:Uncharacterized protein n=1 Tax=Beggiatoa alba B18LD TaxID=395493 RepID=I3CC91_9GAMM|nr:hypothetical protein BegalDRAFT_0314 [Beggiatoa alba B18LD]
MVNRKPLHFRYNHKDLNNVNLKFRHVFIFFIVIFAFCSNLPYPHPFLLFLFICFIIIYPLYLSHRRAIPYKIYIEQRYFVCGNTLLYYKDITKILITNSDISIYSTCNPKIFKIEKDLFPTNARKPEKIINNKNKKFNSVVDKIINNILKVSSVPIEDHRTVPPT